MFSFSAKDACKWYVFVTTQRHVPMIKNDRLTKFYRLILSTGISPTPSGVCVKCINVLMTDGPTCVPFDLCVWKRLQCYCNSSTLWSGILTANPAFPKHKNTHHWCADVCSRQRIRGNGNDSHKQLHTGPSISFQFLYNIFTLYDSSSYVML